jgi:calcineurin-like phosphoesterase family protein
MSNVLFTSDLHWDHKNIPKFRPFVGTVEGNERWITEAWMSRVTKWDTVYVLGDACFSSESLERLGKLPGEKILIRGNHDNYVSTQELLTVFKSIEGTLRYKEFWLTHGPMHPDELRGKVNLHGHVHYSTIQQVAYGMGEDFITEWTKVDDPRYLNCCVENLYEKVNGSPLISLAEVRELLEKRRTK